VRHKKVEESRQINSWRCLARLSVFILQILYSENLKPLLHCWSSREWYFPMEQWVPFGMSTLDSYRSKLGCQLTKFPAGNTMMSASFVEFPVLDTYFVPCILWCEFADSELPFVNYWSSDGWEKSWEFGVTPWDLGKPTPVIEHLVRSGTLPNGRALVPGCGMVNYFILLSYVSHRYYCFPPCLSSVTKLRFQISSLLSPYDTCYRTCLVFSICLLSLLRANVPWEQYPTWHNTITLGLSNINLLIEKCICDSVLYYIPF